MMMMTGMYIQVTVPKVGTTYKTIAKVKKSNIPQRYRQGNNNVAPEYPSAYRLQGQDLSSPRYSDVNEDLGEERAMIHPRLARTFLVLGL